MIRSLLAYAYSATALNDKDVSVGDAAMHYATLHTLGDKYQTPRAKKLAISGYEQQLHKWRDYATDKNAKADLMAFERGLESLLASITHTFEHMSDAVAEIRNHILRIQWPSSILDTYKTQWRECLIRTPEYAADLTTSDIKFHNDYQEWCKDIIEYSCPDCEECFSTNGPKLLKNAGYCFDCGEKCQAWDEQTQSVPPTR
jgi:hypothetical protein